MRGNRNSRRRSCTAYELGYRTRIADVSIDTVAYYDDYDRLMTNQVLGPPMRVQGPPEYLVLPIIEANGMQGQVYGATVSVRWQPRPYWRFDLQYSRIEFDLHLRQGGGDSNALQVAGNSPENQAGLYSYLQLPLGIGLYLGARYVDDLPNQHVPSYVALDANLRWQLTPRLNVSLRGTNLTDPLHPEFGGGRQIERSVLVRLDCAL